MATEELRRGGTRINSSHPHHHEAPTAEAPRRPQFSLAGSYAVPAPAPSYIDPEYFELNPRYNQPVDKPIWGLARPLPRVVRTRSRLRSIAPDEGNLALGGRRLSNLQRLRTNRSIRSLQINTEPIPQFARIPSQRADAGSYSHRREAAPRLKQTASKEEASNEASDFSRYGSPIEEKGDPMNSFISSSGTCLRDSDTGDMGQLPLSKLPALLEQDSSSSGLDLEARAGLRSTELKDETIAGEIINEDNDDIDCEIVNQWSLIRARFREPLAEGLAVSAFPESWSIHMLITNPDLCLRASHSVCQPLRHYIQ